MLAAPVDRLVCQWGRYYTRCVLTSFQAHWYGWNGTTLFVVVRSIPTCFQVFLTHPSHGYCPAWGDLRNIHATQFAEVVHIRILLYDCRHPYSWATCCRQQ